MKKSVSLAVFCVVLASGSLHAQLAITEALPFASTNGVVQGPDFWEITNFGTNTVDLTGYVFNDSDASLTGDANTTALSGISIGPGESIILFQDSATGP